MRMYRYKYKPGIEYRPGLYYTCRGSDVIVLAGGFSSRKYGKYRLLIRVVYALSLKYTQNNLVSALLIFLSHV